MDVVLKGLSDVAVVDTVHERTLPSVGTAGRRRTQIPSVADFLRMLGGHLGPHVYKVPLRHQSYYVTEAETPWVDWGVISDYEGWKKRDKRLEDNWVCPDLDRLIERWESLSPRERRRRGRALWRAVQEDWDGLRGTVRSRLAYFYHVWRATEFEAFSTWVGKLSQLPWVEAGNGTLHLPTELVLDTPSNRLVLANENGGWAGWPDQVPEALLALGVKAEPPYGEAVKTLRELHNGTLEALEKDMLKIARACYELLARSLKSTKTEDESHRMTKKFREELSLKRWNDGLIFAPPHLGQDGSSWWPHNRVLHDTNAVNIAGPYLGYLGTRYKNANVLWNALGVGRDLTPSLTTRVIQDLARVEDGTAAAVQKRYGSLVAALDRQLLTRNEQPPSTVPALTNNGWVPANSAFWTTRRQVERAFGSDLNLWRPGFLDPSTLRRAAAYLGIREIKSVTSDGVLHESWQGVVGERIREPARSRWLQALRTWPGALKAAGYAEDPASEEVLAALMQLEPEQTLEILGKLTLTYPSGESVEATAEPRVLVRLEEGVFLTLDEDLLFSREAAEALAACLPVGSLQAEYVLAALLGEARDNPASLDEQSRRYEWAPAGPQFTQPEEDDEEVEESTEVNVSRRPRPKPPRKPAGPKAPPAPEPSPQLLADIQQYTPGQIERLKPGGNRRVPSSGPRGVRPPRTGKGGAPPEGPSRRPGGRYSNIDIENVAAQFVAEYEWQRGGCELRHQTSGVGADYVAVRDGEIDRYLEIKSSRGNKDAFDMTRIERLAAMKPEIAAKYWVYVVEHLGDGQDPTVTAVWNPVEDEAVSKEPKGTIAVKGWRASKQRWSLTFARATQIAESANGSTDVPTE